MRIHEKVSCSIIILHELENFICKAFKGEAIVNYASPLTRPPRLSARDGGQVTKQMEVSGSPFG